jgi:hypothetical protein
VYSPTQAFGNLIASVASSAGTDPFGNAFVQGVASYSGGNKAAALSTGQWLLYTATGAGGPWIIRGSAIISGGASDMTVGPTGAGATLNLFATLQVTANALFNAIAGINVNAPGATISGGTTNTGGLTTDSTLISDAQAGGLVLRVINTTGGATQPLARLIVQAAGDGFIGCRVAGDSNNRLTLGSGSSANSSAIQWGPGNAGVDVTLDRDAAGHKLNLTTADLDIATAGRGLQIKEGSNARMGIATLAGGTVTVNNTTITGSTRVFVFVQSAGGTQGFLRIASVSPGASFTITSTSGSETSQVAWLLVEPG